MSSHVGAVGELHVTHVALEHLPVGAVSGVPLVAVRVVFVSLYAFGALASLATS